jgi:hypothetical protein
MKSSGSSHERHSLAFAGRAARARRVRQFSDHTRNRHCPDRPGGDEVRGVKAGVPASFIRMEGAGHGFEGGAPADLERA